MNKLSCLSTLYRWGVACVLGISGVCTSAWGATEVGVVNFVAGDAHAQSGQQDKKLPLAKGQRIAVGDVIESGSNAHVHIRFDDNAFVALRPNSRLVVQEYQYNPASPEKSQVKFVLESGAVRSITGQAGQAAKQNFRMNTPLAAIGVRGTDFVAQVDGEATRVLVQSGAVVVAPFSGDCLASAGGPCGGTSAKELNASMQGQFLQIRARSTVPELLPVEQARNSDGLLKSHPQEPAASTNTNAAKTGDFTVAAADSGASRSVENAATAVTPQGGNLQWGRWFGNVKPDGKIESVVDLLVPGKEITVGNSMFAIVRDQWDANTRLPQTGKFDFNLTSSEAWLGRGRTQTQIAVTSGQLSIDFGARQFSTQLNLASSSPEISTITAQGAVRNDGFFIAENDKSNAVVQGTLNTTSKQAGYVFSKTLFDGQSLQGVTLWKR